MEQLEDKTTANAELMEPAPEPVGGSSVFCWALRVEKVDGIVLRLAGKSPFSIGNTSSTGPFSSQPC